MAVFAAYILLAVVNTSTCPLLFTHDQSGQAAFVLPFLCMRVVTIGAVEKWESRAVGEISKGGWEQEKTWVWFSPASRLPSFPRRCFGFPACSVSFQLATK